MIHYTASEMTEKRFTLEDVKNAARMVLKRNVICVRAIRNKQGPFTLVELNDLVDCIVADTEFY